MDEAIETVAGQQLSDGTPLLDELLAASREIYGRSSLTDALTSIVDHACRSTGARYGALSVIGPEGLPERFVQVGLTAEEAAGVGDPPQGFGLLGGLLQAREPVRLTDLSKDPRSKGFPPHHPVMRGFLGMPITLRAELYGSIYLAHATPFDFNDQDRRILAILADLAAVIIENDRLAVEARDRQDWLEASTAITRQLLAGGDNDALGDIAAVVKSMADADVVKVVLPTEDGQRLRVAVTIGRSGFGEPGRMYPMVGTLSHATIESGEPIRLADAEDVASLEVHFSDEVRVGPVIALPLLAAGHARGALIAGRMAGRPVFSLAELDMAATFAGHAGVALELADARATRDRLALLEERGRIARDLHDHVIQRLYAAGLTLQSVLNAGEPLDDTARVARVARVVDEIDEAITQIRTSIFALQGALTGQDTMRGRLLETIDSLSAALGRPPQVRFTGLVDTLVSREVLADIEAVLRESLSNVARHADARSVAVEISVRGGWLHVVVADDGVGMAGATRRSGLENLSRRAEELAGHFSVTPTEPKGTTVRWTIPLS